MNNGDQVPDECIGCRDDWPLSPMSEGTAHVRYTYPETLEHGHTVHWTRMELIPCTRRLRSLRLSA